MVKNQLFTAKEQNVTGRKSWESRKKLFANFKQKVAEIIFHKIKKLKSFRNLKQQNVERKEKIA